MEPNYKELSITMAVAAYGAIANVLSGVKPPKGSTLIKEVAKSIIVAGFCGIIIFLTAKYMKLGIYEQLIAAGISGYMGGRFLQSAEKKFVKKFLSE